MFLPFAPDSPHFYPVTLDSFPNFFFSVLWMEPRALHLLDKENITTWATLQLDTFPNKLYYTKKKNSSTRNCPRSQLVFVVVVFWNGSDYVAQLALNSQASCLHLLSAEIIDMPHCTWFEDERNLIVIT
jgi:hypothetical protein